MQFLLELVFKVTKPGFELFVHHKFRIEFKIMSVIDFFNPRWYGSRPHSPIWFC